MKLGKRCWQTDMEQVPKSNQEKVIDSVKKILSKIAKMGKRMFDAVMSFFNLEISNVGVPVDISL